MLRTAGAWLAALWLLMLAPAWAQAAEMTPTAIQSGVVKAIPGGNTIASPVITGAPNAGPVTGSEVLLGSQGGHTAGVTPAQLATYIGSTVSSNYTGPYTGQVTIPVANVITAGCLNIATFVTAAQLAAVQAGTSSQDFQPILALAVNAVTAPTGAAGACIEFPWGKFPFNSSVDLKRSVIIKGQGGGGGLAGAVSATTLTFPANTTGFYLDQSNTLACSAASFTTTAAGSVIQDLAIVSLGSTAGSAGDGIHMCVRAIVERVNVSGFPNNQVWVDGDNGNANEVRLDTVNTNSTIGDWGVYVHGGDSNAGTFTAIGVANSGGGGIYDGSFLQNTWTGAHVDQVNSLGKGWVTQSGHVFALVSMTAGIGASTTPTIGMTSPWYDMGAGSGPAAWSNVGSYQVSAPIFADGANTRSVWIAPYIEVGYPISSVSVPGMVVGGNIVSAWTASTPFFTATNGVGPGPILGNTGMGGVVHNSALNWGSYGASWMDGLGAEWNAQNFFTWRLGFTQGGTTGDLIFQSANLDVPMEITAPSTSSTPHYGRTAGCRSCVQMNGPVLGGGGNARLWLFNANPPSTTGEAPGEYQWMTSVRPGGPFAYLATVQGAPDTWIPLGTAIGTQTVSSLASTYPCTSANVGQRSQVSDALTPTYLAPLTGGGAVVSPAFCNGTAWVSARLETRDPSHAGSGHALAANDTLRLDLAA